MADVLRYAAFTLDPSGGNPAGVVLDADGMDDERMQQIAAEVGYSETAFAGRATGGSRYPLRYFSPVAEVAFCGHATVATAVVLAEREGPGLMVFDTPAGEIQVETEQDAWGVRASLRSAPTHSRPTHDDELASALSALGWSTEDLAPDYPPNVSFAGNEHLILAVRTRERLAELDYNFDDLLNLMTEHGWTTAQLFWQENEHTFHARDPFPAGGVVEDPATGAAAAALGGYFRALGFVSGTRQFTIHQGVDLGRPSELAVVVHSDDPRVTVAGYAVPIPN
ncbi:PhzF family phenazine biosynthesis protein [Arthrobacter monumenti]